MFKKYISCIVLILLAFSLNAQVIKLASTAPEATPFGEGLNRLAADFSRITGGRVRLQVFHGGVLGDESDAIRKMRLGQIQASVLTTAGIATISPPLLGLSFPGIVQDDSELSYVFDELGDEMDALLAEHGYEVMTWAAAGWMKLFSTHEISDPASVSSLRLASGILPEVINSVFRNLGMQPIPAPATETLSGLNSGLIDTVLNVPLGVAGYQWFGITDKMLDMRIAPLIGTVVIDQRVWRRIPAQYHEELKEAARQVGRDIEVQFTSLEDSAMSLMTNYGLQVTTLSPADRSAWQQTFEEQAQFVGSELLENDFIENVRSSLEAIR